MKFGHQWKDRKSRLPPTLASMCIDYKKYKKTTKAHTPPNQEHLLKSIIAHTTLCHNTFGQYVHPKKPHFFCSFLHQLPPSPNPHDLLEFAQLNSMCLRKLCKRLDKHFKTTVFTKWLNYETHHYNFIKGPDIKNLEIQHTQQSPECPICLEDNIKDDMLILNCGHILCTQCTLNMLKTQTQSSRGTLKNLIAYARFHTPHLTICPVCRHPSAMNNYIHINKKYQ